MSPLKPGALRAAMETVPGWRRRGGEIRRTFTFPGFPAAMAFVRKVAAFAEAQDHHPDIDIRYARVTLALRTHSAGGLTDKDFISARHYTSIGPKTV